MRDFTGLPPFSIIGLPDKAVSEARDRIRSALGALSIALPSRRIIINLSPADMPKVGLHLDLPFALALLAALNSITNEDSEGALAIGELSLDGRVQPVVGTLPAALKAAESGKDLYCPETSGAEAEWVDATRVFATKSLMAIIQHLTGQAPREPAVARQIFRKRRCWIWHRCADKNAQNAPWKLPRRAVIMCSRWAHLDRVNQ